MPDLTGRPPSLNESVKRIIDASQSSLIDNNTRRISFGRSSIDLFDKGITVRSAGDVHFELRDSNGDPSGAIYLNGELLTATGGTFLGLTDTPDDYTGQAGKIVSVKSDETGLEFSGTVSGSEIIGTGCPGSVEQPHVECSPSSYPCDVWIVVGKNGKLRIMESA